MRLAHASGMPGTFSRPSTSKETASWRSRHASRHVRHARAVMHVGIANLRWRGNVAGIPGACATRNFTYLVRVPWHFCRLWRMSPSTSCSLSYMVQIAFLEFSSPLIRVSYREDRLVSGVKLRFIRRSIYENEPNDYLKVWYGFEGEVIGIQSEVSLWHNVTQSSSKYSTQTLYWLHFIATFVYDLCRPYYIDDIYCILWYCSVLWRKRVLHISQVCNSFVDN